ncbi:MAG: hypothetical protein WDZ82_00560 [Candidatus Paceibacterota bacterium]
MEEQNKKWYQKPVGIIALLVLFFPVGLYLMWKYAEWDRNVKWVVTGGVLVVIMIGTVAGEVDEQSTLSEGENQEENKSVDESNLTTEEKVTRAAEEIVGNHDSVEVMVSEGDAFLIFEEETFYTIESAVRDTYEYFVKWGEEALAYDEIGFVSVEAKTQFTDEKGRTSMGTIIRVQMNEENFNEFEWKNLDFRPIHNQIDEYGTLFVHPQVWREVDMNEDAYLSL